MNQGLRYGEPGYYFIIAFYELSGLEFIKPLYWTGKVHDKQIPHLTRDRRFAVQYTTFGVARLATLCFSVRNYTILRCKFEASINTPRQE